MTKLFVAVGLPESVTAEGFRPEPRPYTPHVTLARCGPRVPDQVTADFLARNRGFAPPAMPVTSFGLYSSVLPGEGPVYQRRRSFPLTVVGE